MPFIPTNRSTLRAIPDTSRQRPDVSRSTAGRRRTALALGLGLLWAASSAAQPVGTVRIASGLSNPVYLVAPPDDFNRAFVLARISGEISVLNLTTGAFNAAPFLTVPDVTGEGLQGLAFHPEYDINGYFYVYHFTHTPDRTVVKRFTRSANDPDLADPLSGLTILEIDQPFENHNGGWIGFGPDGYLYVPLGDGGFGCDPDNNSQNPETLLGSLLRLDVDHDDFPADPLRNYAVPADNPFVAQAGRDEAWAYGLRNPFRSSFDRLTGDLYLGDVGQGTREEIDYQPATSSGGENYGWKVREGSIATPTCGSAGPPPPGNVDPIYDYAHGTGSNQGNSVTGGYVYRGPGAEIQGKYFFADFVNSRIWSFEAVTGAGFTDWTTPFVPDAGSIDLPVSFGEDGAGYLYIVDLDGEIFRVVGPFPFVPCPDLVLSNDAFLGVEIRENCRNIDIGPELVVADGGDLTVRAGNRVKLTNGAVIEIGGQLTVEIDPDLQLTPP